MMKKYLIGFIAVIFSFSGQAAREFTDQLGRKVVIDDHVERVAVLQHQTLNLLVFSLPRRRGRLSTRM